MIGSLLDNDLYKFTMQRAIWERYPDAKVTYHFISRGEEGRFTSKVLRQIRYRIDQLGELSLTPQEKEWLEQFDFFSSDYLQYLRDYRFDPSEVAVGLNERGGLEVEVSGSWAKTILWEVPLLAIISETYHELNDAVWPHDSQAYYDKTLQKGLELAKANSTFADFGTRRRRSYQLHQAAIQALVDVPSASEEVASTFVGTSNVHFARQFGTAPIGTMAHEWIMGHAGLFGIRRANRDAMETWLEVFGGRLGIALTDTYTSALFRNDFTKELAEAYEGIRQDSGSPFHFTDDFLAHYRKLGVDPRHKKMVYSDGVTVEKAKAITEYVGGEAKPVFGIGTHLTNDILDKPPLDIVIKMVDINGTPVAKITDDPSKATGEPDALRKSKQIVSEMTGLEVDC